MYLMHILQYMFIEYVMNMKRSLITSVVHLLEEDRVWPRLDIGIPAV